MPLGNDRGERLPHHLFGAESEDLSGGPVPGNNAAFVIGWPPGDWR
jgi:hypothetical protein